MNNLEEVNWAVIKIMGAQEEKFKKYFMGKGIDVYYPTMTVMKKVRHVRKPVEIEIPIYRNYLFVRWFRGLVRSSFQDAPSFFYLISMNGVPLFLSQETINDMKRAEVDGDFEDLDEAVWGFKVGHSVVINEGIFQGYKGVVTKIFGKSGNDFAEIDFGSIAVEIPLALLCGFGS